MPNWRTVNEADLAATISQAEVDAYRANGPNDGSAPSPTPGRWWC